MKLSSIQSRKYILGILKKLHAFIDSESFDPETDLEIVRSKKKDPKFQQHKQCQILTTMHQMLQLVYEN